MAAQTEDRRYATRYKAIVRRRDRAIAHARMEIHTLANEMRGTGMSIQQVADELGVSKTYARELIDGVKPSTGRPARWLEQAIAAGQAATADFPAAARA